MSSDPTPPQQPTAPPTWFARYWKYVVAAVAFAGWIVAAVEAFRAGQPIPAPPLDLPLPMQDALVGPIDYEGCRFSGCDDDHGDGPLKQAAQPARWPTDRITYGIDYASARGMVPALGDTAIQNEARIAFGWWAEQLAVDFVEVPYAEAQIPCNFARIDGPGGTLAQAYLADGTSRPKPLTLDISERWVAGPPAANQVALRTVWCHEIGHSLGLGHDASNAAAVMRPTYSASIPREQERDIGRMIQLGYRRRDKVPPAPTDVLPVQATIKTDDVIEALKKNGFTVTKP